MRTYLVITGVVFALVAVAHLLRVLYEGPHLMHEPAFVILTLLAVALSAWAWRLVWRSRKGVGTP
jgi:hypothetical protein